MPDYAGSGQWRHEPGRAMAGGLGLLLVLLGVLAWTGLLSWFGRLPDDIHIVREHVHILYQSPR